MAETLALSLETARASTSDAQSLSLSLPSCSVLQERLASIDRVMRGLQDGAPCTRPLACFTKKGAEGKQQLQGLVTSTTEQGVVVSMYAPFGESGKQNFRKIYNTLAPSLITPRSSAGGTSTTPSCMLEDQQQNGSCHTSNSPTASSSSSSSACAILQGPRGCGKSLLLQQCLQACRDQQQQVEQQQLQQSAEPAFRLVHLHGRLLAADSVHLVVREILQQLSHQAASVQQEQQQDDHHDLVRLKQTSFTNHIQFLNEILNVASADGIPIVFVLDELDAFCGIGSAGRAGQFFDNPSASSPQNHQLLLYHLLDRVAQQPHSMGFVGITSHQGYLALLEKRIRSRLDGTATFVQVGLPRSYDELVTILNERLLDRRQQRLEGDAESSNEQYLQTAIGSLFIHKAQENTNNESSNNSTASTSGKSLWQEQATQIHSIMEYNYRLGKSVRWFMRVLSMTLALYKAECLLQHEGNNNNKDAPPFEPTYLLQALFDMGATPCRDVESTSSSKHADTRGDRLDARTQALADLSGPQVALMFAVRRIVTRDSHREQQVAPLTLNRILQEYKTYSGPPRAYQQKGILLRAFHDLMEIGVLRPAIDHSGAGPFQYQHGTFYKNLDVHSIGRLPLRCTFDIHRELRPAMDHRSRNVLQAPTALLEWGKKIN